MQLGRLDQRFPVVSLWRQIYVHKNWYVVKWRGGLREQLLLSVKCGRKYPVSKTGSYTIEAQKGSGGGDTCRGSMRNKRWSSSAYPDCPPSEDGCRQERQADPAPFESHAPRPQTCLGSSSYADRKTRQLASHPNEGRAFCSPFKLPPRDVHNVPLNNFSLVRNQDFITGALHKLNLGARSSAYEQMMREIKRIKILRSKSKVVHSRLFNKKFHRS